MRFDKHPIDKMVYVVGNEQEYHFKVLSLLLDRLGYAFGKGLVHFSYGMVELPDGKMKSREGTVVDADDLMDEMVATARAIAEEQGKGKDMPAEEAAEVARRVGLGSLKYFILKVDPRKNMTSTPRRVLTSMGTQAPSSSTPTLVFAASFVKQRSWVSLSPRPSLGLPSPPRSRNSSLRSLNMQTS